MTKLEGKCKEVMDRTEWVAIATCGENGSHIVATWGDYVRALATEDGDVIVVPAGHYNITEENLKKNNRIEMLIASREVEGNHGPGQGCCITGKGEIHTSGKLARMATSKFPWARGALVIKVEEVKMQL